MSLLFSLERSCSVTIRKRKFAAGILMFLGCLLLSASAGFAQDTAKGSATGRLTLSEVVDRLTERNAERAATLTGYRSQRSYQIDYKGIPSAMHAEMVVDLKYSAPST